MRVSSFLLQMNCRHWSQRGSVPGNPERRWGIVIYCPVKQDKHLITEDIFLCHRTHSAHRDVTFRSQETGLSHGKASASSDRGWIFSQDILYEIKSFPQRQVKVKSILDKHAYNILNFGFMFHIDYTARSIPAHGYGYDKTIHFNANHNCQVKQCMFIWYFC